MHIQNADELQKFLASSSINERMNWAREQLLNHDGWLDFTVEHLLEVGDDLMVANCRGWGKQKRAARLTFTRHDGFLWGDIVYNRAMRITQDSYFSSQYQRAVEAFRNGTDTHVIEMVYQISKWMSLNDEHPTMRYEYRDVAERLHEQFNLKLKPDQRRSIQAVRILQRMYPAHDIDVGDFAWLNAYRALLSKDEMYTTALSTMERRGFTWKVEECSVTNTVTHTTMGLSAGNRGELCVRYVNTDKAYPDAFSNLLKAGAGKVQEINNLVSAVLNKECTYYGVDLRYVLRDIRLMLKALGLSYIFVGESETHTALSGSVFPQPCLTIEVDMTHESLYRQPFTGPGSHS